MKANMILWDSARMVRKIEQVTITEPFPDYGNEIKEFDNKVVSMMADIDRALREAYSHENESPIAQNIWRLSRIMVYT